MELGGEEVGGGEYKQTIFYVLFKSSNNEKVNLKKKTNFITTQDKKHRIHLKVGCDERFSNYIYKLITKGKNYHIKVHKNKKSSIFKKTIKNL